MNEPAPAPPGAGAATSFGSRPDSLSPEKLRPRLLQGLIAFAFLGQAAAFYALRFDDPFITFRYGQNLVLGHGLVFNPGERLLGSTAPGHMLLSALVYAIFGQELTPSVMSVLGCVGWTAQALAVYRLLHDLVGRRRALAVAFALELGASCAFMWIPFETNLVSAFVLWAFVALKHERYVAVGALAGFASLMRPDALVAAVVLGAVCVWRQRARAALPIAVFLGVFLPWVIFAWLYYGSPLPQSAITKFQRASFSEYCVHILQVVGETALPFAETPPAQLVAWLLIGVGAVLLTRRDRTLALYALYAFLHACAYLYLRPFVGHEWHLYPLQLAGAVFLVGGIAAIAARVVEPSHEKLAGIALGAVIVLALLRMGIQADTYPRDYWTGQRNAVYRHIAQFFRDNAKPDEVFASVEVGTLAYYTHMRVHDLGGLVTSEKHETDSKALRWLVLDSNYMWMAPPWEPAYIARSGGFHAFVFHIPRGKKLSFASVETLSSQH